MVDMGRRGSGYAGDRLAFITRTAPNFAAKRHNESACIRYGPGYHHLTVQYVPCQRGGMGHVGNRR